MNRWYQVEETSDTVRISPLGVWRLASLPEIFRASDELNNFRDRPLPPVERRAVLNGSQLQAIDTSGALCLLKILRAHGADISRLQAEQIQGEHKNIVQLVLDQCRLGKAVSRNERESVLVHIGKGAEICLRHIADSLAFIGETVFKLAATAIRPTLFRAKEFFAQLENVCLHAIPICALVTFLIGTVVAYLFAGQIAKYGANIFIVDGVAISMCREMSPIIVAIIMAGRSGSAFTAQIGTMKLNEEIDALVTLGLSPMRVLVFPRLLALIISMPLLVFVGDVIGILGGAIVANAKLGITYHTFYERLQTVLLVRHFAVGLVKAPVFAAFIAVIGCRMGLSVENNTRSVGLHTTSTVVQSIVSVILLNAAFAVIFVELGI